MKEIEGISSILVFYEKPGCINNTKQKVILEDAGFSVDARNLLTTPWSAAELRSFFCDLPVGQWFNRSAPAVKSGDIVPEQLAEDEALNAMLADPLLIRRPLIAFAGQKWAGFFLEAVQLCSGREATAKIVVPDTIEICPRSHSTSSCTPSVSE